MRAAICYLLVSSLFCSNSAMYKMSLVHLCIKPGQTCQHLGAGNNTIPLNSKVTSILQIRLRDLVIQPGAPASARSRVSIFHEYVFVTALPPCASNLSIIIFMAKPGVMMTKTLLNDIPGDTSMALWGKHPFFISDRTSQTFTPDALCLYREKEGNLTQSYDKPPIPTEKSTVLKVG